MTVPFRTRVTHLSYLLSTFPKETTLALLGALTLFGGLIGCGLYLLSVGAYAGAFLMILGIIPLLSAYRSVGKEYVPTPGPEMPWNLVEENLSEIGRIHPMLEEITERLKIENRRRLIRLA